MLPITQLRSLAFSTNPSNASEISSSKLRWLALPLLLAVSACASGASPEEARAHSQAAAVGTLTISGNVTDAVSHPVAGVKIQLTGAASQSVFTDSAGHYVFSGLGTGSYSLTPSLANCSFTPNVLNLNNMTASQVKNFAGAGSGCGGNPGPMGPAGPQGPVGDKGPTRDNGPTEQVSFNSTTLQWDYTPTDGAAQTAGYDVAKGTSI